MEGQFPERDDLVHERREPRLFLLAPVAHLGCGVVDVIDLPDHVVEATFAREAAEELAAEPRGGDLVAHLLVAIGGMGGVEAPVGEGRGKDVDVVAAPEAQAGGAPQVARHEALHLPGVPEAEIVGAAAAPGAVHVENAVHAHAGDVPAVPER